MDKNLLYGLGRRCINPQVPVSLAGYFNIRMWEKVADDIEVRTLVLKQGKKYSAIVQFDLVTASPELLDENMNPGELFSGITKDNRFCFNRRYWMKNGAVVTNPGKLNPDISRPEGEVDYEIPLIGIKSKGRLKVLFANIVNHTDTIGNSEVSSDWAGFFIRKLESKLGNDSMVMPLIGAAGNINHFDVSTSRDQSCYEEAKRIGNGYAETVEKALSEMLPAGNIKMVIKNSELVCGPREIPRAELEEAKLTLEKYKDIPDPGAGGNLTSEDLARKTPAALKYFAKALVAMADNKEPVKFNLVGIFLGNSCIISLPGEPFVEIGLQIRKGIFPQYNTMVVSHSNGTGNPKIGLGYI
ncbi:MAG: hypothetical protein NT118_11285, partial [Lentisphaerae bacterium]|nr:hypothetical protein [Lentisphaerota bacterium]